MIISLRENGYSLTRNDYSLREMIISLRENEFVLIAWIFLNQVYS